MDNHEITTEYLLQLVTEAIGNTNEKYYKQKLYGEKYYERNFCYEFYHQLRLLLSCNMMEEAYILSGEPSKDIAHNLHYLKKHFSEKGKINVILI